MKRDDSAKRISGPIGTNRDRHHRRRQPIRRLQLEALEPRTLLSITPAVVDDSLPRALATLRPFVTGQHPVAKAADGGFLVAVETRGGVYLSRLGSESASRVNLPTGMSPRASSVATSRDGSGMIVWVERGARGGTQLLARWFDPQGQPIGTGPTVVASFRSAPRGPSVAITPDGEALVAWTGRGPGESQGIFARRYGPGGAAGGAPFRVNQSARGPQRHVDLAASPDSGFMVTWDGAGAGDAAGVFLGRIGLDGTPSGTERRVNVATSGSQVRPAVAIADDGRAIVAWHNYGQHGSRGLFARQIDTSDAFLGVEAGGPRFGRAASHAAVIAGDDGNWIVSWARLSPRGWGLRTASLLAAANRFDIVAEVGIAHTRFAVRPTLARNGSGPVLVVRVGLGPRSLRGLVSRRLSATPTPPNPPVPPHENPKPPTPPGPLPPVAPIDLQIPVVIAALAHDTGSSVSDGLTSDPTVIGTATDNARISGLEGRFEGAGFVDLTAALGTDGRFVLDRATLERALAAPLADGRHTLGLRATDSSGNRSPVVDVTFTLDATAPGIGRPILVPGDDRGSSDSDGITNVMSTTILVTAEPGSLVRVTLDGSTLAEQSSPQDGMLRFSLARLGDGRHEIAATVVDAAGNRGISSSPLVLVIDSAAPAPPVFGLAPSSDTGILGDGRTSASRVTLVGTTEPLARLTLRETGFTATAGADGIFRFLDVPLELGANALHVDVSDLAGNLGESSRTLTRVEASQGIDDVLAWNTVALETIRIDAAYPPLATRALAMTSLAVYDALNAVDGSPGFLARRTALPGTDPAAAIAAAAHGVLAALFPAQQARLDLALTTALDRIPDGEAEEAGIALGQLLAADVIAARAGDGYDATSFVSVGSSEPGQWRPTLPAYEPGTLPQWGDVDTFAVDLAALAPLPGPPALDSLEYARALDEVRRLGAAIGSERTADQTQIARFWADGLGTDTPPGHWNRIATEVARERGNSLADNARMLAALNVALADTSVVVWGVKYAESFWRPITAIREAAFDGNPRTSPDLDWIPLLVTPAFPDYISGHSTYSGAAAEVLTTLLGSAGFSIDSQSLPGVRRAFSSFNAAAAEAGASRIYGGIHYEFSDHDGQAAGRAVAHEVLASFNIQTDTLPPSIRVLDPVAGAVVPGDSAVRGQVLDFASGTTSLVARIDDGPAVAVPFDLNGNFSIPIASLADGSHAVVLVATDAAGNVSPELATRFTRDTRPPSLVLNSPANGGVIVAGGRLSGVADGTGSAIVALGYRFDGGTLNPIVYDRASGRFDVALDLSRLGAGSHAIEVVARDASGREATLDAAVTLAAPIPLAIAALEPSNGAIEVGTTFRPRVDFTRPIDPSSLTAANFYATGPGGDRLPASIVPSQDGSFAWLFFTTPMPSSSRVTLHLDGGLIRAADGGDLLDADGNGTPGGLLAASFTTVDLASLPGTSISGVVLDPGPDLRPMTFDDVRAGADGVLTTADDVFLFPIAGVKVFVVGREDHFALTDANGRFRLDGVPAGDVKLAIEGRTATNAPSGFFFPEMVMDLRLRAGESNTVMNTIGAFDERVANVGRPEVYLPRLGESILVDVAGPDPTRIVASAESTPSLTASQRAVLSIEIPSGSLIDAQGRPMASGRVGISAVPPELVREMLPAGILEHTFDITIQAPGVAVFRTPAPLSFPNVFRAAPGTQLNFLSFDHTTGRLEIEGTMTVSADGLSVKTDPGMGITHPGWHGIAPLGGPGGPEDPPPPDLSKLPGDPDTPIIHDPIALPLIAQEMGGLLAHNDLRWVVPDTGWLTVQIEVDGPLKDFMKRTGDLALTSQAFTLTANQKGSRTFSGTSLSYDELVGKGGFASIEGDRLYGAHIRVTETHTKPDGRKSIEIRSFYLYRWVSAVYEPEAKARQGTTVGFQKTLDDGPLNWETTKTIAARLPVGVLTTFSLAEGDPSFRVDNSPAKGDQKLVWNFDPVAAGTLTRGVAISVSGQNLVVGTLTARGTGIEPVEINVNEAGYRTELKRVLLAMVEAWFPGGDFEPGKAGFDDDGNGTKDDKSEYGWPGTDDHQATFYKYSEGASAAPAVLPLMNLRGPAARLGLAGTIREYVLDPSLFKATHAGADLILGTADDEDYFTAVTVSITFQNEFDGFLPANRADAGADGILTTYDDLFTAEQMAAFDAMLLVKSGEIRQAVEADYGPVDGKKGAFKFVDIGGQLTLTWDDTFTIPGDKSDAGTSVIGAPIYGFADFDADTLVDQNGDGLILKTILADKAIPDVAKVWAMAQEMNAKVENKGMFSIAINTSFKSKATFAQFVANSVSHELGHTFGLQDSYINVDSPPGNPDFDNNGNAIPFDIMRLGLNSDPDLTFLPSNIQLLRAAMGIAPEGDIGDGLVQYRKTFWTPKSAAGIRHGAHDPAGDSIGEAVLVAATADGFWYGGDNGSPLDAGAIEVDGIGGEKIVVAIGILNAGGKPLKVSSIGLVDGLSGFSLDAVDALRDPIEPGETVEIFATFDPSELGKAADVIEIVSDARNGAKVRVPLSALGIKAGPSIGLTLDGGGNFGGVKLGSSLPTPGMATLTNVGRQPLIIKAIRFGGTGAFKPLGVPVDLATAPRTLQPGQSLAFGARFQPDHAGPAREFVEVETNDPERPVLRFTLIGTGLPASIAAAWGNDYVAIDTPELPNAPTLLARSDDAGNFEIFLPSDTLYVLTIFDPETGLLGRETGVTSPSGQKTILASRLVFSAPTGVDTDGDGLSDEVERSIGTSPRRADTDDNGIDDFTEVQQGLDPLGGRPVATGILAQLAVRGEARQLVVVGAIAPGAPDLAYLATGSHGLAIVDVTQPGRPILLSELDLPGDAADISVDSDLGLAVVASGAGGLLIVDVSDPSAPRLVRTVDASTNVVEVSAGFAYIADGSYVESVDIREGLVLDRLYVGGAVGGLAREGRFLYATAAGDVLTVVELDGPFLKRRGQTRITGDGSYSGALFVGGGVAYVMNINPSVVRAGGYATVDISEPEFPVMISPDDHPGDVQEPAAAIAANGSGLAVLVGSPGNVGAESPRIDLVDVTDPQNTYRLLRSTLLPTAPQAVAVAAGTAFVAGGAGGLVVVNYLSADVEGVAPVITVRPPDLGGADPFATGRVAYEGRLFRLPATVLDDIQVRAVDLLLQDKALGPDAPFRVVRSDLSYPFDLEVLAPALVPADNGIRVYDLRLRATDTGGNVTLSDPSEFTVLADLFAPRYFRRDLIDGSVRGAGLDRLSLYFSEPIARASMTPAIFKVVDAQNAPVAGLTVQPASGDRAVELRFNALATGTYRLVIDAPNVRDRASVALGATADVTRIEVITATENFWAPTTPAAQFNWNNPTQWSLGRLPGPSDLVRIDLAANQSLSVPLSDVTVRGLIVTGGTLVIAGSESFPQTFNVAGPSQIAKLAISGGLFANAGTVTIGEVLKLNAGFLGGVGEIIISPGASMELRGGYLSGQRVVVAGEIKGIGSVRYTRDPVIEVQAGATFVASNNFTIESIDGSLGRLDLFGRFTTISGSTVGLGLEVALAPGGQFAPGPGRLTLKGGVRFSEAVTQPVDSQWLFAGPPSGQNTAIPRYVLPAGVVHRFDGLLQLGGGDVLIGGDLMVRSLTIGSDFFDDDFLARTSHLTIDGTATITENFGSGLDQFGRKIGKGGLIDGRGLIVIEPTARYSPSQQTFRGVTIRNLGLLDLGNGSFSLGLGSVFEHEGTIRGNLESTPTSPYGFIEVPGFNGASDQSLDQGVFNARVPIVFYGSMRIRAAFNAYASIELRIPQSYHASTNPYFQLGGGALFRAGLIADDRFDIILEQNQASNAADPRYYANRYEFAPGTTVVISGYLRVSNSSLDLPGDIDVRELRFSNSADELGVEAPLAITARGNIRVRNSLLWLGGRIAASGGLTLAAGASGEVGEPSAAVRKVPTLLDGTTFINQGSLDLTKGISLGGGALLRNEAGGVLSGGVIFALPGGGRLENAAELNYLGGFAGDLPVQVPLVNLPSGVIRFGQSNGLVNRFASIDNAGLITIDLRGFESRRLLIIDGDFIQKDTGILRTKLAIYAPSPSPDEFLAGRLFTGGTARLGGRLEVDYALYAFNSPAAPRTGDAFTIIDATAFDGDFAAIVDLDPDDGSTYDANRLGRKYQLIARATG